MTVSWGSTLFIVIFVLFYFFYWYPILNNGCIQVQKAKLFTKKQGTTKLIKGMFLCRFFVRACVRVCVRVCVFLIFLSVCWYFTIKWMQNVLVHDASKIASSYLWSLKGNDSIKLLNNLISVASDLDLRCFKRSSLVRRAILSWMFSNSLFLSIVSSVFSPLTRIRTQSSSNFPSS